MKKGEVIGKGIAEKVNKGEAVNSYVEVKRVSNSGSGRKMSGVSAEMRRSIESIGHEQPTINISELVISMCDKGDRILELVEGIQNRLVGSGYTGEAVANLNSSDIDFSIQGRLEKLNRVMNYIEDVALKLGYNVGLGDSIDKMK